MAEHAAEQKRAGQPCGQVTGLVAEQVAHQHGVEAPATTGASSSFVLAAAVSADDCTCTTMAGTKADASDATAPRAVRHSLAKEGGEGAS